MSIDGLQDTHDRFRGRTGGYELAFRAAKSAVEAGLTVTVSTVANATNVQEIPSLYESVKAEIILSLEKKDTEKLKDMISDLKAVVNAREINEGKFKVEFV